MRWSGTHPGAADRRKGDPERGRAIVANRQVGLCLLCHSGPFPDEKFQGTLAPDLKGTGGRWSEGQLRLRIVDSSRLNRDTIMPSYYRVDGLTRVAPSFQGKPILPPSRSRTWSPIWQRCASSAYLIG